MYAFPHKQRDSRAQQMLSNDLLNRESLFAQVAPMQHRHLNDARSATVGIAGAVGGE
jgi:hypothetical protein